MRRANVALRLGPSMQIIMPNCSRVKFGMCARARACVCVCVCVCANFQFLIVTDTGFGACMSPRCEVPDRHHVCGCVGGWALELIVCCVRVCGGWHYLDADHVLSTAEDDVDDESGVDVDSGTDVEVDAEVIVKVGWRWSR